MYIISGCLLGHDCKYDGGNNRNEKVIEFCQTHSYCIVCPETAGKLPAPRPPAEQIDGRVIDRTGKDLTEAFLAGARASRDHARHEAECHHEPIEGAILKAKSPSCGSGMIYDGSFSGKLIEGDGIFSEILKKHGIKVITEKEI